MTHQSSVAAEECGNIGGSPVRVIENALIRAEVAPAAGGKFVSLKSKRTGTEWLLPPLRPYEETSTAAGFELWDGGGFDECLPTVAPTVTAPDHGEVWRNAWTEESSSHGILLRTTALNGAVSFARRAHLDGASLLLEYSVESTSQETRNLLYCAHPLLHVRQTDRILLPSEAQILTVEGSAGNRLGHRGDRVIWPKTRTGEDLSIVGPPDGLQADKLFAGPLARGWCALVRPSIDEGVEVTFDSSVLPYLGIWICRAAWPNSGNRKQYTVAFEPASAPADNLLVAERAATAWKLAPGERRAWTIRFRLGTVPEIEAARNAEGA